VALCTHFKIAYRPAWKGWRTVSGVHFKISIDKSLRSLTAAQESFDNYSVVLITGVIRVEVQLCARSRLRLMLTKAGSTFKQAG
jgi:hypothetical protein